MLIGINWIAPQTFPLIEQLIHDGLADFCEIMVDNFIHLDPRHLQKICQKIPTAFHLVSTRFLEKDEAQLFPLAEHIRQFIDCLQPIYVSDHLVRFKDDVGRNLPVITEPYYALEEQTLINKIAGWQNLLNTKLLLENHASLTANGQSQPDFFRKLMINPKLGLLFDFSNAYIADANKIVGRTAWEAMIMETKHFHVGGFQVKNDWTIDTHDAPVAPEVLQWMEKIFKDHSQQDVSCVVEFDAKVSAETWKKNITCIRQLYERAKR